MKIKEFNQAKIPLVKIDKKLNKYSGKVLFEEKLEKANNLLKRTKLPPQLRIEIKQDKE